MAASWGGLWSSKSKEENPQDELQPMTPVKDADAPGAGKGYSSWGTSLTGSTWSGSKLWSSATKTGPGGQGAKTGGGAASKEQGQIEAWARQLVDMTADNGGAVDKETVSALGQQLSGSDATAEMRSDFADALGKRLADPSIPVKLKTARVMMLLMPAVDNFRELVETHAGTIYIICPRLLDPVMLSSPLLMLITADFS
eukprot:SAG31_NODE_298_length_18125_cov_27.373350_13_plen_199_part_00